MTILDQIIADKKIEVEERKLAQPYNQLKYLSKLERKGVSLKEKLLSRSGIIAEFKRKSPSKGVIRENADVKSITQDYQNAGAAACSILTDKKYFNGSNQDILDARPGLIIPILRKEFIIDPYQIIEAKIIGADIVLLIAECLTKSEINEFCKIAHDLDLEVLMELHFDEELDKWNPDIDMLGINNRNLKSFETGIERSVFMADKLPKESIWISESGLKGPEELAVLSAIGYRGFLIGETFMKAEDPGALCEKLVNSLSKLQVYES
ncbi:MAG: indole-3-glycerol phosphate synthase TrpC [Saprospiraceae bacterium]